MSNPYCFYKVREEQDHLLQAPVSLHWLKEEDRQLPEVRLAEVVLDSYLPQKLFQL